MNDILSLAGAGALLVLAITFVVAIFRTLSEGVESFAAFDRAGFTLANFWRGTIPARAAHGNQICIGESAEIEIVDGRVRADDTRTVVKHHS